MNFYVKKQIEFTLIKIYRSLIFPILKWKDVLKKNVTLAPQAYYDRQTVLLGCNYVGRDSFLTECQLGYGSYIADKSYMAKTEVGKYCSIGAYVKTAVGNHPIRTNVSSCPSFFSSNPANGLSVIVDKEVKEYTYSNEAKGYCITIENDVWIGTGVVILSGVTIHNGAVIGAGSVVTKDVEPYGIYAGNPARKIGSRFSESEVSKLLMLQWWNKDEAWIIENAYKFKNTSSVLEKINNGEKINNE